MGDFVPTFFFFLLQCFKFQIDKLQIIISISEIAKKYMVSVTCFWHKVGPSFRYLKILTDSRWGISILG